MEIRCHERLELTRIPDRIGLVILWSSAAVLISDQAEGVYVAEQRSSCYIDTLLDSPPSHHIKLKGVTP